MAGKGLIGITHMLEATHHPVFIEQRRIAHDANTHDGVCRRLVFQQYQ